VKVKVRNLLPSVVANIAQDSISTLGDPGRFRDPLNRDEQFSGERVIARIEVGDASAMHFGNHEDVYGSLGMKIVERQHVVVLEDLAGRNLASGDSAEYAVHGSIDAGLTCHFATVESPVCGGSGERARGARSQEEEPPRGPEDTRPRSRLQCSPCPVTEPQSKRKQRPQWRESCVVRQGPPEEWR
jgi:hypothetical protein